MQDLAELAVSFWKLQISSIFKLSIKEYVLGKFLLNFVTASQNSINYWSLKAFLPYLATTATNCIFSGV